MALPALVAMLPAFVWAEESPLDQARLNKAISKGLQVVEKAASSYPSHRSCFSCHHQTLPMLAMVTARKSGKVIDEKLLQSQADFSHQSFSSRLEEMKEGKGIGGRAFTIAYGLWALDLAGRKPDETTDAMISYLLKTQKEDGHWAPQTIRPPLEESKTACTVLAIFGLNKYSTPGRREKVDAAIASAKAWLTKASPASHEDFIARFWGLRLTGAGDEELSSARKAILRIQHEDGGWSQLPQMASDAYATGQAVFALKTLGGSKDNAAIHRGVEFLLRTQEGDGSWRVETRSRPVQTFFDNGDPHGKHQFISIPATSWAVAALSANRKKASGQ